MTEGRSSGHWSSVSRICQPRPQRIPSWIVRGVPARGPRPSRPGGPISVPQPDGPFLAIFDHDGVLVDSLDFHQGAWLELGRRTGLAITPEFIHETFGMTNASI